jgi:hypothetical protein
MNYRCRRCEHRFCSIDDISYCPACDCTKLVRIDDEI